MSDRGIIFSGDSVRKILSGEKTITRRITAPQPATDAQICFDKTRGEFQIRRDSQCDKLRNPYGLVGARLWARETFRVETWGAGKTVWFAADDERLSSVSAFRWTSPIFLPRALSRITVEIVDIRVEPLQWITEADARAEGVKRAAISADGNLIRTSLHGEVLDGTYRDGFAVGWDVLNRRRGSWASNPWVWRIEFKRVGADRIAA